MKKIKKLSLKKESIANLNENEMVNLRGGANPGVSPMPANNNYGGGTGGCGGLVSLYCYTLQGACYISYTYCP